MAATGTGRDEDNSNRMPGVKFEEISTKFNALVMVAAKEYESVFSEEEKKRAETLWTNKKKKRLGSQIKGKEILILKKTKSAMKNGAGSSNPPPRLPGIFWNNIMGVGPTRVKFLIEKRLCKTDVSHRHGRLQIPMNQVKGKDFLTDEEKIQVHREKRALEVLVVDPTGTHWTLDFKQWTMRSSSPYVFSKQWNQLVKENNLRAGKDIVQLWSFRCNSELCFALNVVRDDE
ncbi:hypothetical protein HHK36_001303 [Tetracentron sinense]|uniref:TF-B3 domain-containing protein n=1 Tax=Tetracentron sinense TaxID=13715 RepID=A0A834ZSM9_TETSI|nr:hypothetical protein HHK36_001303 [Tetracentron sinense]